MTHRSNSIKSTMNTRNKLQEILGFVFDFDGTLVDSKIDFPLMKEKIVQLLKKWDVYVKGIDDKLYALELIQFGCNSLRKDPLALARFREEALTIVEHLEMERCSNAIPFPDTERALNEIHQRGYKIGIISRNGKTAIKEVLSRFSFPHDVVLTRDDVEKIKPDPSHLLKAINVLGLKPSHTAMVGDHPIDMKCGKGAGVFIVGVLTGVSTERDLREAGADVIVRNLAELVANLRSYGIQT